MWALFRNESKIVRSNKYCICVKHLKGIKKERILRNETEFFTFCAMYVQVMWRIIRSCNRSRGKHVTSKKPYISICWKCDLRIIRECMGIQFCCRHRIVQRKKKKTITGIYQHIYNSYRWIYIFCLPCLKVGRKPSVRPNSFRCNLKFNVTEASRHWWLHDLLQLIYCLIYVDKFICVILFELLLYTVQITQVHSIWKSSTINERQSSIGCSKTKYEFSLHHRLQKRRFLDGSVCSEITALLMHAGSPPFHPANGSLHRTKSTIVQTPYLSSLCIQQTSHWSFLS